MYVYFLNTKIRKKPTAQHKQCLLSRLRLFYCVTSFKEITQQISGNVTRREGMF